MGCAGRDVSLLKQCSKSPLVCVLWNRNLSCKMVVSCCRKYYYYSYPIVLKA